MGDSPIGRAHENGYNTGTSVGDGMVGACPPGECELIWDKETLLRRCRKCGYPSQALVDEGSRHPMPGDYRLVCYGPLDDESEVCPIGPGEATPHKSTAIEDMNDHQRKAVEVDGEPHDVEVIRF